MTDRAATSELSYKGHYSNWHW